MKKRPFTQFLLLLLFSLFSEIGLAQVKISGKVLDESKNPIAFAAVSLKGTYDGASTNENGEFKFKTSTKGKATLFINYLGFDPQNIEITIADKDIELNVTLKEKIDESNTVVISAGSFEASDKKRATILKPLDIVTTAGASGDITGALKTLPGAQQIGESEGLFVRGGTAGETKTIIDEMVVQNPYYSSIPDVPQRGRFSPFLFTGTVFSTGGYSAQYGQALSSTLTLSTDDLADQTSTGISASIVGVGANHTERWKNTQLSVEANYSNLGAFFFINPQNRDWIKTPETFNGSLIFRQKTSESGIFKIYGTWSESHSTLSFPSLVDLGQKNRFDIKNMNFYSNSSYKDYFGKWGFFAGLSYSRSKDNIAFDTLPGVSVPLLRIQEMAQAKTYISREIGKRSSIRIGGEVERQNFEDDYGIYLKSLSETYGALFAESDIFITQKLAARVGARAEYSKVLDKYNAAPRLSLAYKTGKKSQVSLAYGNFYQTPDRDLLYLTKNPFMYSSNGLNYETATHYILNYQYMDDDRTFRIEGYYKKYNSLTRIYYDPSLLPGLDSVVDNTGNGYAQGFDVFWRDKKSIKNVDYWISYSYLDTKRLYRRYQDLAMPTFAATHTVSVVYKQYVPVIASSFSLTYTFASGRPYYDPQYPVFLGEKTIPYNDLSLGYSYLTEIRGNFTVLFLSLSNIPNFKNIYGYRYSNDGKTAYVINAPAGRTIFVGCFISISKKTDK